MNLLTQLAKSNIHQNILKARVLHEDFHLHVLTLHDRVQDLSTLLRSIVYEDSNIESDTLKRIDDLYQEIKERIKELKELINTNPELIFRLETRMIKVTNKSIEIKAYTSQALIDPSALSLEDFLELFIFKDTVKEIPEEFIYK